MTSEGLSVVKALIIDMDGVLWRSDEPLGDLPAIFNRIHSGGLKAILATNNATRTPDQYLEKVSRFGVQLEPWQVITSSQAAAHFLHEQHPEGGPVYIIGEGGLVQALDRYGFYQSADAPLAVVAGLDRHVNYEKLSTATYLIRTGTPFIGTNPDPTFPAPEGLIPGSGAILAALEAATDVKPFVVGKPAPGMYRVALERLGTGPEETLVIGDRLDTDISGGQSIGCYTGLVLSGVATREEAQNWRPSPDIIAADFESLLDILIMSKNGSCQ